jgi:hypothetical protein
MFLTVAQLEQASKRKRPKAQLDWALDRGFVPDARHTDADGRPLVPSALFNHAPSAPVKATPKWEAARG